MTNTYTDAELAELADTVVQARREAYQAGVQAGAQIGLEAYHVWLCEHGLLTGATPTTLRIVTHDEHGQPVAIIERQLPRVVMPGHAPGDAPGDAA